LTKHAKAFAPAAISSFFEICDKESDGKPITDLERVGARGGGFGLQRGVLTEISVSQSKINRIQVLINGKSVLEAKTTKMALSMLLRDVKDTYDVFVDHKIDVPVSVGFGTSAGGALTACLALKETLKMPLTYNQIGRIAHIAEIQCKTGLGTVSSLTVGGNCMLVLEPGAPGIGIVDRIPFSPEYVIVVGIFRSRSTEAFLSSNRSRAKVDKWGRETLDDIISEPSIENFLACSWRFAHRAGFATERVKQLVHLAKKAGAVGAAQNMIGEAVHAVVREEKAPAVAEAFKQVLPTQNILVSRSDFQGVRLVSGSEGIQ
jgi:pantoate kinase